MFYIIDTQGTTQSVSAEPIYQGSVGVNNITLLAPFPANTQISVYATLPNGISLRNLYQLSATTFPQGVPNLRDANGNIYTAFSGKIHESLTSYPGIVEIWFKVALGVGRELHTYKTSFNVAEGGISDPISIPSDEQYLDQILQYLAELNSDPLASVVYESPKHLKLPNEVTSELTNTEIDSTPQGTVDFIGYSDGYFINAEPRNGAFYFDFDYDEAFNAQLVQFWIPSPVNADIEFFVQTAINNNVVEEKTIKISKTTESIPINPRVFLSSKAIDKIRIIVDNIGYQTIINGVQVFSQNIDGEYVFTLRSGAQAIIKAPDGETLKAYYESAEQSKNDAESAYQDTLTIKGETQQIKSEVETIKGETQQIYQNASALEQNVLALKNTAVEAKDAAVTEAMYAASSAANAANSAEQARETLQTILGRRTVHYESDMKSALSSIANSDNINEGDMVVIGAKDVPDLIVFNNGSDALANAEIITMSEISNNTYPEISAGSKFRIIGGTNNYGFVAIETGIDTSNFATKDELNDSIQQAILDSWEAEV